jgi:hypothetical protein
MSRPRRRPAVLVVLPVLALLAACTSSTSAPPSPTVTGTRTVVQTRPATPVSTYTPPPARSAQPLSPGARPPRGAKAAVCPYIKAGLDQQPTSAPNVADIEGDRVYRTVVLTDRKPVGCAFYFWAPPFEAIADILPTTFPTADDAYDAMVRTADAGSEQIAEPDFVPGVNGVRYRTRFFGPDGARDWAFVFAKGKIMVVVHTQQNNVSINAQLLGQAVVDKF